MAAVWGRWSAHNAGEPAVVDSLTHWLLDRRDRLTGLERLLVKEIEATTPEQALDVWREILRLAPGSGHLKHASGAARRAGRLEEALGYLRAADPSSGWLYGWFPYFFDYARILNELDRCEEILDVAELARTSLPALARGRIAYRVELQGLSCLGRAEALDSLLDGYLAAADSDRWTESMTVWPLHAAADSLLARHPEEAESRFVRRVVELLRAASEPSGPEIDAARFDYAEGVDRSAEASLYPGDILLAIGAYREAYAAMGRGLASGRVSGALRQNVSSVLEVYWRHDGIEGARALIGLIAREDAELAADLRNDLDALERSMAGGPESTPSARPNT